MAYQDMRYADLLGVGFDAVLDGACTREGYTVKLGAQEGQSDWHAYTISMSGERVASLLVSFVHGFISDADARNEMARSFSLSGDDCFGMVVQSGAGDHDGIMWFDEHGNSHFVSVAEQFNVPNIEVFIPIRPIYCPLGDYMDAMPEFVCLAAHLPVADTKSLMVRAVATSLTWEVYPWSLEETFDDSDVVRMLYVLSVKSGVDYATLCERVANPFDIVWSEYPVAIEGITESIRNDTPMTGDREKTYEDTSITPALSAGGALANAVCSVIIGECAAQGLGVEYADDKYGKRLAIYTVTGHKGGAYLRVFTRLEEDCSKTGCGRETATLEQSRYLCKIGDLLNDAESTYAVVVFVQKNGTREGLWITSDGRVLELIPGYSLEMCECSCSWRLPTSALSSAFTLSQATIREYVSRCCGQCRKLENLFETRVVADAICGLKDVSSGDYLDAVFSLSILSGISNNYLREALEYLRTFASAVEPSPRVSQVKPMNLF